MGKGAIIGGVAGVAVVGGLLFHHFHKSKPAPDVQSVGAANGLTQAELADAQAEVHQHEADEQARIAALEANAAQAIQNAQNADMLARQAYAMGNPAAYQLGMQAQQLAAIAQQWIAAVQAEQGRDAAQYPAVVQKAIADARARAALSGGNNGDTTTENAEPGTLGAVPRVPITPETLHPIHHEPVQTSGLVGSLGHATGSTTDVASSPVVSSTVAEHPQHVEPETETHVEPHEPLVAPVTTHVAAVTSSTVAVHPTPPSPPAKPTESHLYTIQAPNTLWGLAKAYNMTWQQLYAFKGPDGKTNEQRLAEDRPGKQRILQHGDKTIALIYPGETIYLPGPASAEPAGLRDPAPGEAE